MKMYEKVEKARKEIKSLEEQARIIENSILGMRIKAGTINSASIGNITAATISTGSISGLNMSYDLDEIIATINRVNSILTDLSVEVVRPIGEV